MTGTADGKYLFCIEGATMIAIEPAAAPGTPSDNFANPVKEFTLGQFGVSAVRMAVDPDADFGNGYTLTTEGAAYRNYVFMAAGKNGLWMVDGDIGPGPNRVGRVDDSGAGVATLQFSNRYCNDVGILELGGQTYVAAIFAKRQQSHLRLYEIEKVRAVLGAPGSSGETGNEIEPDYTVVLNRNPDVFPALPGPSQVYRSFATDLEIDQPAGAPTELYVYVAMMTDGIVRVRLRASDVSSGATPAGTVAWGPRFGDASHYATTGTGSTQAVCNNFEFINVMLGDPLVPGSGVVERSEPPPVFCLTSHRDVPDGQDQSHGHKLYAAAERLGFLVFDIADPAVWSDQMPIDHHEGQVVPFQGTGLTATDLVNRGAWPETMVLLEDAFGGIAAGGSNSLQDYLYYPREMDVLDSPTLGLHLVATCYPVPLAVDPPRQLEGFSYTDFLDYGAVTNIFSTYGQVGARTNIYRVGYFPQGAGGGLSVTAHTSLLDGGTHLFVPKVQSNQMGATGTDNIEFVHAQTSAVNLNGQAGGQLTTKSYCMTSVDVSPIPTTSTPLTAIRPLKHLAGRRTFGLGHSLLDPDLIQTSINDGIPREGVPYLSGTPGSRSIDVIYDAMAPDGDDFTFAGGLTLQQESQWLGTVANTQFLIGEGRPTVPAPPAGTKNPPDLKIVEQHVTPFSSGPPVLLEVLKFVERPAGRWTEKGRELYMGGIVSPRYDQWIQARVTACDPGYGEFVGAEFLFCFRQETPDGLSFCRRDLLMADLANVLPGAKLAEGSPANAFDWFLLNTHPEFNQFPAYVGQPGFSQAEYDAAKDWFNQPTRPMLYRQRLKTWAPRMVCVQPAPRSSFDKGWVLAVPCGTLSLEAEEMPSPKAGTLGALPDYRKLEEFLPTASAFFPSGSSAVFADHFEDGLVQFFDFTNPRDLITAQAGAIPSASSTLPMQDLLMSNIRDVVIDVQPEGVVI
ncbi:hypothetical protein Poly30_07860 [Planctomycetes bacterium Poly30]|uniref:Uncharacterized protein n=1 Tax=Saltatorellus ferox TaxID=2528018 RepID=A0A518EMH8_9BACT|nr:hypothetical protein Poly30_07860 [Planctomycetes bacterium Poly30]